MGVNEAASLTPAGRPARLLGTLVERAGRLVTRDELRQALWGDDTFVDVDAGLNYCLGRLRAVLGDVDHAFEWLERGLGMRDGGLLALRVSPPFEPLRSDPRFDRLAARIGLRSAATLTG